MRYATLLFALAGLMAGPLYVVEIGMGADVEHAAHRLTRIDVERRRLECWHHGVHHPLFARDSFTWGIPDRGIYCRIDLKRLFQP